MDRIEAEEQLSEYITIVAAAGRSLKPEAHRTWKRDIEMVAEMTPVLRRAKSESELQRMLG